MAYQTPSYKRKVIAAFSSISNCNFGQKFSSEKEANGSAARDVNMTITGTGAVNEFINQNKENWEVVWGPVTDNSQAQCKWHTDNTMYVVKTDSFKEEGGTTYPLYVVAIAGTNAISIKGWLKEDLNVWHRAHWGKNGHGKISGGTDFGLNELKGMEANGITLLQFFQDLSLTKENKPYEIAVCGHSLGGALSPVMALWLREQFPKQIKVATYPSAGATAGTGRFNKYFLKTLGKENYHSIINAHDVVPHSWQADLLLKIPSLYDKSAFGNIPANPKFQRIVKLIKNFLNVKFPIQKYKRIASDKEALTTFEGRPNPDNTCHDFAMEAIYQHTIAYAKDGFQWPVDVRTQLLALQRQGKPIA